jgi:hypothetical protein
LCDERIRAILVNVIFIAAALISILAAGFPALVWLYRRYQKTLGSRHVVAKKLDQIACGIGDDYVRQLLGAPTFTHMTTLGIEHIYVTRHALMHIILSSIDGTVVRWAVTTTDVNFRPMFRLPPMDSTGKRWTIRLLATSFAEITEQPLRTHSCIGARRIRYSERYYFGNPGAYQTYLLAYNDAGVGELNTTGELIARSTVINTFGVEGPHGDDQENDHWNGPDVDQIRVLDYPEVRAPISSHIDRIHEFHRERKRLRKYKRDNA